MLKVQPRGEVDSVLNSKNKLNWLEKKDMFAQTLPNEFYSATVINQIHNYDSENEN